MTANRKSTAQAAIEELRAIKDRCAAYAEDLRIAQDRIAAIESDLRAAQEQVRAAQEREAGLRAALLHAQRFLTHREDRTPLEVCYDWCPRCKVDAALAATPDCAAQIRREGWRQGMERAAEIAAKIQAEYEADEKTAERERRELGQIAAHWSAVGARDVTTTLRAEAGKPEAGKEQKS